MTTAGGKKERKDCVVRVNCINVRAVPIGLRDNIHPHHKLLLEVIEKVGKDGQARIKDVMAEFERMKREEK